MADGWRVTYMGEGVKPTAVGAFAKYVTAYVDEDFAKSLAGQQDWVVADPSGNELGSKPQPKKAEEKKPEEKKAEEKKPEKAEEKKPEKAPEPKPEKAPEKAEKK